ncbi:MAG: NADH-quinone oxidoreductase subunit NuoB [Chlamydiae bacterium]|nr:NADH-quinone oxidoreductase subunit NuoB [Chlamydiota bacterium]MBI3276322.1 NADH-quinone oxidoreductase subunit NuoB [Chlamydiota bacterium]
MWQILKNRIKQGYRTSRYPKEEPVFPSRFRGKPVLRNIEMNASLENNFQKEKDATGSISWGNTPSVDMGKLLFNEDLKEALPSGSFEYSNDYRMAVSRREDLILQGDELKLASALNCKMKKILGHSLRLREVSAGSCGGCDAEVQALGNVVFDLSRFGIGFVASPRHADGLLVTGPVTKNMKLALKKTYEALPDPKIVIAVGACAASGGPFMGGPEVSNGVDSIIPVDLYVPGCPPHPLTILDGLLRLLGRLG